MPTATRKAFASRNELQLVHTGASLCSLRSGGRASKRSYCPSEPPAIFRRACGSGRSASRVTGTGSRDAIGGQHFRNLSVGGGIAGIDIGDSPGRWRRAPKPPAICSRRFGSHPPGQPHGEMDDQRRSISAAQAALDYVLLTTLVDPDEPLRDACHFENKWRWK